MCTTENEKNGQTSPINNGENKKMEIEITRYKKIVEAFNTPRSLAKLIIVISLIIVLVFLGISVIALVVKSYYPYKTVNSNEYGATIIQNEDNEVIYWLFNTADLWANSGIHVKKGDIISVRASGAFHSSIHHLVHDAAANRKRRNWVHPIGGPNASGPREEHRASYRISSTHSFNTLLMQVIPEDVELKDHDGNWRTEYSCYLDGRPKEIKNNNQTIDHNRSIYPDIYAIGDERDKITIRRDGVLHFAVNDIALTRNIIMEMKRRVDPKICKTECKYKGLYVDSSMLRMGEFPIPNMSEHYKRDSISLLKGLIALGCNDSSIKFLSFCDDYSKNNEYNSRYKEKYVDLYKKIDSLYNKKHSIAKNDSTFFRKDFTELDYYLITNFVDAWFADNAGSYLIVIERKKQ